MRRTPLLPLAILALALATARAQTVLYVNGPQTTGANTGTTWPDAFRGDGALQRALDAAAPLVTGGQAVQLWIAAGTYKPTARTNPGDPSSATFALRSGLELYGGFEGNETALGQREPGANATILSGFLGPTAYDRVVHVVTASGVDATCIIDGLIICDGGWSHGASDRGGGIYSVEGSPIVRSCRILDNNGFTGGGGGFFGGGAPRIEGCWFEGNSTGVSSWPRGGALWGVGARLEVLRCTFVSNTAGYASGGAVEASGNFTDCAFYGNGAEVGGAFVGTGTFIRCTFDSNGADAAGALSGTGVLIDCMFTHNRAYDGDGTLSGNFAALRCTFYGGGSNAGNVNGDSFTDCTFAGGNGGWSPAVSGDSFLRCTFIGNTGSHSSVGIGSAAVGCLFIGNLRPVRVRDTAIVNCTFLNNPASTSEGALSLYSNSTSTASVSNCIFWGNGSGSQAAQLSPGAGGFVVNHCCIQGWDGSLGGTGNFAMDPRLSPDGRLLANSPCTDAGDSTALPPGTTTDLFGNPRLHDDPGMPNTGPADPIDVGAAEFQGASCYPNCDASTAPPVLSAADFACFLQHFAAGSPYANCDASPLPPRLNVADFTCFLQRFAAGCP